MSLLRIKNSPIVLFYLFTLLVMRQGPCLADTSTLANQPPPGDEIMVDTNAQAGSNSKPAPYVDMDTVVEKEFHPVDYDTSNEFKGLDADAGSEFQDIDSNAQQEFHPSMPDTDKVFLHS